MSDEHLHILENFRGYGICAVPAVKDNGTFYVAHLSSERTERTFPLGRLVKEDIPEDFEGKLNSVTYGPIAERTARRILNLDRQLLKVVFITTLVADNWRCGVVCCLLDQMQTMLRISPEDGKKAVASKLEWVDVQTIGYDKVPDQQYAAIVRNVYGTLKGMV